MSAPDIEQQGIVRQTRCWIETVVIGCNFCPFARQEFVQQRILYQVSDCGETETCLHELAATVDKLENNPDITTALLILPTGFSRFDDFIDLNEIADALLAEQGYEGTYQLASFHPQYCFADAPADDPANYTNRSPYPMLHILRESSIEQALANYPDADRIPERNVEYTRRMGLEKMRAMLQHCIQKENAPE